MSHRLLYRVCASITIFAGVLSAGCGGSGPERGERGATLAIGVTPLTLPGITDACYDLSAHNGLGDPIWSVTNVCADRFGDGEGAITYIGPCDASPGAQATTVTLTLTGLFAGDPAVAIATSEYVNPCPTGAPCRQIATCRENADVPVTFNIAVMRDADQGFFDVAVNFDDIFCSAKVDCAVGDLLHDPVTGERDTTVVLAFACTAGPGQDTVLNMNDISIECPGHPAIALDPTDGPGNYYQAPGALSPYPLLFQVATYLGDELFPSSEPPLNKCYWNVALGVNLPDASFANCTLSTSATASQGSLAATQGLTPANTMWPVVRYSVPLTDALGAIDCEAHGLDQGDDVVTTSYTPFTGQQFCYSLDCQPRDPNGQPIPGPVLTDLCTQTQNCPALPGDVALTKRQTQITVSFGPASSTFSLPAVAGAADATLQDCCVEDCCQSPVSP